MNFKKREIKLYPKNLFYIFIGKVMIIVQLVLVYLLHSYSAKLLATSAPASLIRNCHAPTLDII